MGREVFAEYVLIAAVRIIGEVMKLALKLLAQAGITGKLADLFEIIEVFGIEHDKTAHLAKLADQVASVIAERLGVALAEQTPVTRAVTARAELEIVARWLEPVRARAPVIRPLSSHGRVGCCYRAVTGGPTR
jgi:hypothetical protein